MIPDMFIVEDFKLWFYLLLVSIVCSAFSFPRAYNKSIILYLDGVPFRKI